MRSRVIAKLEVLRFLGLVLAFGFENHPAKPGGTKPHV